MTQAEKGIEMKVSVFTGKLGGYSAMLPMLRLMRDDDEVELTIIAGDQHCNINFGHSIDEIKKEFLGSISYIPIKAGDDTSWHRANGMQQIVHHGSMALDRFKPDCLILFGDRAEVLTMALSAVIQGIPIAHIQGGDFSGGIDNRIRDSISCLSKWHFVSNKRSDARLSDFVPGDIINVGDLHIDSIVSGLYEPNNFGPKPRIILLQHSDTSNPGDSGVQVLITVLALQECDLLPNTIAFYPCTDQGYEKIIETLKWKFDEEKLFKYLPPSEFLGLLSQSDLVIGNSSLGIIEAPYFDIPTVDIGTRQAGRMRGSSVFHSDHDVEEIVEAINLALQFRDHGEKAERLYGNGEAGRKVLEHLKEVLP